MTTAAEQKPACVQCGGADDVFWCAEMYLCAGCFKAARRRHGEGGKLEDFEIRVPRPGELYRHYKGGEYEVIAVGRLSEQRDAIMVVYRSLERGHVWIRPLGMWGEYVEWRVYSNPTPLPVGFLPGQEVVDQRAPRVHRTPRFTLIRPANAPV